MPEVRIDAVAQGDALSLDLAEELQQLAPFGMGNPAVSLLVPAAHDDRPAARSARAATSRSRSARAAPARAASPSAPATRCRSAPDEPADAAVRLEIDRWNGAVSPKLVLRQAQPCRAGARSTCSASPSSPPGCARELDRDLGRRAAERRAASGRALTRDLRGTGIAGLLGDLVASGEPVLAVTAHAPHRARALADRVGGFALTSWAALEDDPGARARRSRTSSPSTRPRGRCSTIRRARAGPTWRGVRLN